MRYARLVVLGLVAIAALAFIAGLWSGPSAGTNTAGAALPVLKVGLDMNPDLSTTGAYPTPLPTFEACRDIANVGDVFYIDAFVLNAPSLSAFSMEFQYSTGGKISIQESNVTMLFGTSASGVLNVSDPVPNTDGLFMSGAVDTGVLDSGSGVLARLKLQAIGTGVAQFGFSTRDINLPPDGHPDPVQLRDASNTALGDTNGDASFDGPFVNAASKISIGQPDPDLDGLSNGCDNCPNTSNANQSDIDGDGIGDVCDSDKDGDGIPNTSDTCPTVYDPTNNPQSCADDDNDGIFNGVDNCPTVANGPAQAGIPGVGNQDNNDGDSAGDACDPDDDNDGVLDTSDNCQFVVNVGQQNAVHSLTTAGDHCEDPDADLVVDLNDNCPDVSNENQLDGDGDGVGTACDNCAATPNPDQKNTDVIVAPPGDAFGDACDGDDDNDLVIDVNDNCPLNPNANQANMDGDGAGDVCDNDADGDGYQKAIETFLGSSATDLDSTKKPEVCDGEDNDGDGTIDEGWDLTRPPGSGAPNGIPDCTENVDTDGDGIANPNDPDDDNDGRPDTVENAVVTNAFSRCAATTALDDEPVDSVPSDLNDDRKVTLVDVLKFIPLFNTALGNPVFDKRYDVVPNNVIGLADVLAAIPVFNVICTP